MSALSKQAEEIFVIQVTDGGDFQLQKRVLSEVDVYRVNTPRRVERVVERIAACRGDHDDVLRGVQSHYGPVDAGVFPACVVH